MNELRWLFALAAIIVWVVVAILGFLKTVVGLETLIALLAVGLICALGAYVAPPRVV